MIGRIFVELCPSFYLHVPQLPITSLNARFLNQLLARLYLALHHSTRLYEHYNFVFYSFAIGWIFIELRSVLSISHHCQKSKPRLQTSERKIERSRCESHSSKNRVLSSSVESSGSAFAEFNVTFFTVPTPQRYTSAVPRHVSFQDLRFCLCFCLLDVLFLQVPVSEIRFCSVFVSVFSQFEHTTNISSLYP